VDATGEQVGINQILDFVSQNHHAVLATTRSDGGVQLSPVAAGVDGDGHLIISSRETAMKTRNLRKRPAGWLCVFTDRFFGSWHQAEGSFEVVSLPDAMEGLIAYYRSISGEHPDWADYERAMREERRVLLMMTVARVGPTKAG
jgi:PPOX class probable F420-dependent enzyme